MVMLTLKQFQYFIKIVEEGSFTAASEKLFIAQSALSRQMKLLEEEIDFQLFDRTDKKVKLTAAGEAFYKKIKDNMHYLKTNLKIDFFRNFQYLRNHILWASCSYYFILVLHKDCY